MIEARAGGFVGGQYVIDRGASTANTIFTVQGNNVGQNRYSLDNAVDADVKGNDVIGTVTGTQTETILAPQLASASRVVLSFANTTNVANNQQIRIDNGIGTYFNFVFQTTAVSSNPLSIQRGATLAESLQNAASRMNNFLANYTGVEDFTMRQLSFRQEGNTLVADARLNGTLLDATRAALNITETTSGTLSASQFNSGKLGGVITEGITNKDFIGTIGGFTATRTANNRVTLALTVGQHTYRSAAINTAPTALTTVRLTSNEGGYFDIQFAANAGSTVSNQTQANAYAARLNQAFSALSFSQSRTLNSVDDAILGGTLELRNTALPQSVSYTDATVLSAASNGGNAQISLTLGGETFTSSQAIGGAIGSREIITLQSTTNPLSTLRFTNGATPLNLANDTEANAFAQRIKDAFGYSIRQGVPTGFKVVAENDPGYLNDPGLPLSPETLFVDSSLSIEPSVNNQSGQRVANAALLLEQINKRLEVNANLLRGRMADNNKSAALLEQIDLAMSANIAVEPSLEQRQTIEQSQQLNERAFTLRFAYQVNKLVKLAR